MVQGDADLLLKQGYDKHQVQGIAESDSTVAYLPKGMVVDGLIELPGVGKQTLDHYSSVVQLAGLLCQLGFEEIAIYHNQDVDISCKINGLKVGFEYENYNNKNLDIIVKKKEAALGKYDIVRFISSSTDLPMITRAVGSKYSIKRGIAVREFIESLTEMAELPKNDLVLSGMESIPAL